VVLADFQRLFHVFDPLLMVGNGHLRGVHFAGGQIAVQQFRFSPPALVVDGAVMHAKIARDLGLAVPLSEHLFDGQAVVPGQVLSFTLWHIISSISYAFASLL